MLPPSLILRLARRLHAAWAGRTVEGSESGDAWRALDNRLALVGYARHRFDLARAAGLSLIVPQLRTEVAARLNAVFRQIEQIQSEYDPPHVRVPDLGEWLAEVRQLEAEFDDVDVRWSDTAIRVVTEPVVLEDVYLGAFAIDFVWDRVGGLPGARCFDVIALDPHPAAGRDDVVHPHVRDGVLCSGDAQGPLGRALAAGRLADAFLLVRSVLLTYNSHSPHVALDEWNGFACAECGYRADDDDRSSCEACGVDLCESCSGCCAVCCETRCGQCTQSCDDCQTACCPGCLETTGAGRSVCPECVPHCPRCSAAVSATKRLGPAQLCSNHQEEHDTDDNDAIDTSESVEDPAAVA